MMTTEDESGLDFISEQETELLQRAVRIPEERGDAGLEGLIGNLDSVIIATEPDRLVPAVCDLLRYTGLSCTESFFDRDSQSYVLSLPGSASVIVRSRTAADNPFAAFNKARMTGNLPGTRLETFVFNTNNLRDYITIQMKRGVRFLTPAPLESEFYSFIQTAPSRFTGNSLGFIEWYDKERFYVPQNGTSITTDIVKPAYRHLKNISVLDHTATRVRAQDRTAAILEFISLTSYHYDFAVYVKSLNSITSVARRNKEDFAMVFTSGITSFSNDADSGPTEKFIRNYGTRVHHMAFQTSDIETTVSALKKDGMAFLLNVVGSEEEGLKQIFSEPSPNTLIVNEYIHRYGDFDGFFTRSNVEQLTKATEKQ
jgi:hypothetical protein